MIHMNIAYASFHYYIEHNAEKEEKKKNVDEKLRRKNDMATSYQSGDRTLSFITHMMSLCFWLI